MNAFGRPRSQILIEAKSMVPRLTNSLLSYRVAMALVWRSLLMVRSTTFEPNAARRVTAVSCSIYACAVCSLTNKDHPSANLPCQPEQNSHLRGVERVSDIDERAGASVCGVVRHRRPEGRSRTTTSGGGGI